MPDDTLQGLPEMINQDQREAGQKDISAAFNRQGYELCPPLFKSWPCHDAVLQGKDSQQYEVDDYRHWPVSGHVGT